MFGWGHFEWPVMHNGRFISHLGLLRLIHFAAEKPCSELLILH